MKKYLLTLLIPSIVYADSLQITLENDCFGAGDDSDYSHGTEVIWMSNNSLWYFDDWGIGLQQNMYTPEVIESPEIQYGDHPYCGYLSLNFIGDNYIPLTDSTTLTIQNWFGFGTIGPNALAEESQTIIHKLLGCKKPLGWDNQISNELIAQYQLWMNLNYRVCDSRLFDFMIIPRFGLMAGGFKDELAIGFDFKFGLNPSDNVGSGLILSAPADADIARFYLLAGVEGKCVFHDSSLDGGLFRDSVYTVESETWVGELRIGFGVQYNRFELNYLFIARSHEYEGQDEAPNYGRIMLKYYW